MLHRFSRAPLGARAAAAAIVALSFGCSAGSSTSSTGFDDSSADTGAGAHHGSTGPGFGGNLGAGGFLGGGGGTVASTGSGPLGPAEVFAHGPSVLYKLDPDTKVVTTIGRFRGCDQVDDIAIDKDGVMYGTTMGGLYVIDKTTAACTQVATGSYPNSLSFVPQGTLDPNEEALVGYLGGEYVRIDKATGAITHVGPLGNGYQSSGDIVSVIGGGTYLTVKGNGCSDCIVEVNPTTGALISTIGHLGHSAVYGLAFWAGAAYGFDDAGELFQIDLTTAATTTLSTGMPVSEFYGAGSTTAAPLGPH